MPYNIAFDAVHKPRGKIDENYSDLRDYLNSNEFTCYNFLEFPITRESLKSSDILVFPCPDFAKITSQEITEIETWVKQDGGGLLLLSHAGGDRGRNSNLSELSQRFGIGFENDQVLDHTNNLGMENVPLISNQNFNPPHPITNGIDSIAYRTGCSSLILGNAFALATSNETSEPFSSPIICVSTPEKGRVCCIGSYEMFRNQIGGGFKYQEHPKLVLNLFNWLVSEYRIELESTGEISEIKPSTPPSETSETEQEAPTYKPFLTEKQPINIDFAIKISNKSELMELLEIFSNQINTIKNTIDNLVKQVSASEDEIIELKKKQISRKPELEKESNSLKENNSD